jgi:hypothetical protein
VTRPYVAGAALVLVVGALGYGLGRAGRTPTPTADHDDAPKKLAQIDDKVDRALAGQSEMRSQLGALDCRVDLAARGGAAGGPSAAPMPSAPDPAAAAMRSPDAIAAQEAATNGVLADAIRTGRWSPSERTRMRQALAETDDEGRHALLRELAVAINAGTVKPVDLDGPPI